MRKRSLLLCVTGFLGLYIRERTKKHTVVAVINIYCNYLQQNGDE